MSSANHDAPEPYSSEDIQALADEITRYLQNHDCVADTLEGIAQWWILRQRLQEERSRVEQAMNYLCLHGIVAARELPNGVILYSPTSKKDAPDNVNNR